jgi:DNA modification methylase
MKKAKVSQFKQDPQNLNLGNDKGNAILQQSIQELGAGRSILVDKNGFIIAGNKTAQAALNEGLDDAIIVETAGDKLVVVQRTDLDLSTDPRAKQLAIADNRVAEINLEWDTEALKELATEIDLSWLEIDNSFIEELEKIAEANNAEELEREEGLTDEDEVPDDADIETRVKKGDVWQLGRHRVMCGDSTFIDDVDKLMDGEKADMMLTDPPYGVSYADKNEYLNKFDKGNRNQSPIKNDHLSIEETAESLWYPSFSNAFNSLADVSCFYCFMPQGGDQMMMMMMMNKSGLIPRHELIWLKNNHVLGRTDYAYKHEPIIYGWKRNGTHKYYGEFHTSIFEFSKPLKSELHPTMKPIELLSQIINNSSLPKQIILDLFLGSGSTLIACEKTGRTCYGMELSEKYCDVILKRWEDFTGKTAVLVED